MNLETNGPKVPTERRIAKSVGTSRTEIVIMIETGTEIATATAIKTVPSEALNEKGNQKAPQCTLGPTQTPNGLGSQKRLLFQGHPPPAARLHLAWTMRPR